MQKLVQGIHNFQNEVFGTRRKFFERLADGQAPIALFITCSDSRINPNLITQTQPGDLFIMRNAGNIIPPYNGALVCGESATIEFAISELGVKDVIVCGHSHCGAMSALLNGDAVKDMPAMRNWLTHAESTRRIMMEKYPHLENNDLLTATVEENVLVQLENLRTHPVVAARIAAGQLNLHAWVYKLETGQVFAFNPAEGQYLPITEAPPLPTHANVRLRAEAVM